MEVWWSLEAWNLGFLLERWEAEGYVGQVAFSQFSVLTQHRVCFLGSHPLWYEWLNQNMSLNLPDTTRWPTGHHGILASLPMAQEHGLIASLDQQFPCKATTSTQSDNVREFKGCLYLGTHQETGSHNSAG